MILLFMYFQSSFFFNSTCNFKHESCSTPCHLNIIWLTLPQYLCLQYIFRATGTKLDSPWGGRAVYKAPGKPQVSWQLWGPNSPCATKEEVDNPRGRDREIRGRGVKTESQRRHNERRDSRSAHDDGLEETLCGSQVSAQLLVQYSLCILLPFSASFCWYHDNKRVCIMRWLPIGQKLIK